MFGMARAAHELINGLQHAAELQVLCLSGPTYEYPNAQCNSLNADPGLGGRLTSLRPLRQACRSADRPIVTVGIWAGVTVALATLGLRRHLILWEHTILPSRIRFERSVRLCVALLCLCGWRFKAAVAVNQQGAAVIRSILPKSTPVYHIYNLMPENLERSRGSTEQPVTSAVHLAGLGVTIQLVVGIQTFPLVSSVRT